MLDRESDICFFWISFAFILPGWAFGASLEFLSRACFFADFQGDVFAYERARHKSSQPETLCGQSYASCEYFGSNSGIWRPRF